MGGGGNVSEDLDGFGIQSMNLFGLHSGLFVVLIVKMLRKGGFFGSAGPATQGF